MPLDPSLVGREYGPYRYELGLEKMREFAYAIAGGVPSISFGGPPPADLNPVFFKDDAVAFPTFAVNFAMRPFTAAVTDPEIGLDLVRVVHGEQEFEFLEVMRAHDLMTTTGRISNVYEKGNLDFLVVETETRNQHGRAVLKGRWTAVVRR